MPKPLVADCTLDRIMQLSNDLSENIASGSVQEWRAVAKYYIDCLNKQYEDMNSVRLELIALATKKF